MRDWLILILVLILFFSPFLGFAQVPSISVSVTVPEKTPPPPPPPPPGIPPPPAGTATAVFKGKAYPDAFITILKDGRVAATFKAEKTGLFSKTLTGLAPQLYTFGIWAEDTKRRKSLTISFSISLVGGMTTTMEFFLPPTFELEADKVEQGRDLGMAGQTFPLSTVNIFVYSPLGTKTSADKRGEWSYKLDTTPLALGIHASKVQSQTVEDGELSPFSDTKIFRVVERGKLVCANGDLNRDRKVNIIDFSILLYWWKRSNPCADQNGDGIVNLADLSILLYYWTG